MAMDIAIRSVQDRGTRNTERVLLEALADCDLGEYLLADSTYSDGGTPSNKVRHVFFFPPHKVKKGDWIELWTITTSLPQRGERSLASGARVPLHRFSWGLKEGVWNDTGDCAYLIKKTGGQRFQVPAVK